MNFNVNNNSKYGMLHPEYSDRLLISDILEVDWCIEIDWCRDNHLDDKNHTHPTSQTNVCISNANKGKVNNASNSNVNSDNNNVNNNHQIQPKLSKKDAILLRE